MRSKFMTLVLVILILFILAGMILTVYTWVHFMTEPDGSESETSSEMKGGESLIIRLSPARAEWIDGISEARAL